MQADQLGIKQFYIGEAAQAAGIDTNTCRSWLKRGSIVLSDEDRAAAGAGRPQLLSLRRVLQIAITAELVKLGMSVKDAANAAIPFTDLGETVTWWVEGEDPPEMGRGPAELFSDASATLLAVKPDGGHVVRADRNTIFTEVMAGEPIAFLYLDPLVHRVKRALGADK
jgi:hypothetical protein